MIILRGGYQDNNYSWHIFLKIDFKYLTEINKKSNDNSQAQIFSWKKVKIRTHNVVIKP